VILAVATTLVCVLVWMLLLRIKALRSLGGGSSTNGPFTPLLPVKEINERKVMESASLLDKGESPVLEEQMKSDPVIRQQSLAEPSISKKVKISQQPSIVEKSRESQSFPNQVATAQVEAQTRSDPTVVSRTRSNCKEIKRAPKQSENAVVAPFCATNVTHAALETVSQINPVSFHRDDVKAQTDEVKAQKAKVQALIVNNTQKIEETAIDSGIVPGPVMDRPLKVNAAPAKEYDCAPVMRQGEEEVESFDVLSECGTTRTADVKTTSMVQLLTETCPSQPTIRSAPNDGLEGPSDKKILEKRQRKKSLLENIKKAF